MIKLNELSLSFGERDILKDVNLIITTGSKSALVGRNGEGKTTLLKLILGELQPDSGSTSIKGRVGYLPQNFIPQEGSAYNSLKNSNTKRWQILKACDRVGLNTELLNQDINTLSGGEKTKLHTAGALLNDPQILILDEPTNHLDLQSRKWMVDFINGFKGIVLVVSHDRHFLDEIAEEILELDTGNIKTYPGNYTKYAEAKKAERARQQSEYDSYIRKKNQLEHAVTDRKKRIKSMKKTPTRMGDSEARLHKRSTTEKQEKVGQSVLSMQKRISMIAKKEKPMVNKTVNIKLIEGDLQISHMAVEFDGITKYYDDRLILDDITLMLKKGTMAALTGLNGSGKTTLLRLIIKDIEPDSGEIIISPGVKAGYLPQEINFHDRHDNMLEFLGSYGHTQQRSRDILGMLLFRRDEVFKTLDILSMGEKLRLYLAKLMLDGCNLLLLDEPTNHLDLWCRSAVEDALLQYGGTLLFVSHDRYFLDKLANEVWELDNGKIRIYNNSWSGYKRAKESRSSTDKLLLENRLAFLSSYLNTDLREKDKEKLTIEYEEVVKKLRDYN